MKKPWWVRAIGILGWLSAAVSGVFFYGASQSPLMGYYSVPAFFFMFVALGLWALWAAISFILFLLRRNVQEQAVARFNPLADLGRPTPPHPVPVPPVASADVWDNPPTRIKCDNCERFHALLFCARHGHYLCFPCVAKHDSADCMYLAAGRRVDASHVQAPHIRTTGKVLGI